MSVRLLTVEQVLYIHDRLIEATGGSHGVRALSLLESAIARPRQGFGERELFPDLHVKAAALLDGIARNHPFVDGNKRTGFAVAGIFLQINGWQLTADDQEALTFTYAVAEDHLPIETIRDGLVRNSQPVS
jgi:death-on-curing protein